MASKVRRESNVRIIDPNQGFENVNHEDLFTYVKLTASTKGRSIISRNDEEVLLVEQTNSGNVKDTTNYIHSGVELNTDYTDIGGPVNNGGDNGGFGVTNINIDVKSSFVPQITIDFVDVRGDSLFGQGPCSPYASFFHMPYPVFNLTVKGYYGKPVVYTLALRKFNTSFNSDNGNFEIKAEFIGYTYAFLTDIIIGYAFTGSNMPGGKKHLDDLWGKIDKEKHGNNPLPKDPINLLTLVKDLKTYEKVLSETTQKAENSKDINVINDSVSSLGELVNIIKELESDPLLSETNKKAGGFIKYKSNNKEVKNLIDSVLGTKGKFYNRFNETKKNLIKIGITTKVPEKLSKKIETDKGVKYTIINTSLYVTELNNTISDTKKKLKDKKKATLEKAKSEIQKEVSYNPTILNVMTILLINVEVFLKLLLDSSLKAEEIHKNKTNNNVLGGAGSDDNTVFPWPTYVNNTTKVEKYPKEEKQWEEVKFVENFLASYLTYQEEISEILDDITDVGGVGFDYYIPANPIESIGTNSVCYHRTKDTVGLLNKIATRAFVYGDFSSSNSLSSYVEKNTNVISDEVMYEYGKSDGFGAYNTINEDKLRVFFNSLELDGLINEIGNTTEKLTYEEWLDGEDLPNGVLKSEVTENIKEFYGKTPQNVVTYGGNIELGDLKITPNKKIDGSKPTIIVNKTRKITLQEGSLIQSRKDNSYLYGNKFINESLGEGTSLSYLNAQSRVDRDNSYFSLDNDTLTPSKSNENGFRFDTALDTFDGLDDQTFGQLTRMNSGVISFKNGTFITPVGFGRETTEGDSSTSDTVRNSTIIQSPLWVYNRSSSPKHKFFGWGKDETSEDGVVVKKTNIVGRAGDKDKSNINLAYLFLTTIGYDDGTIGDGSLTIF